MEVKKQITYEISGLTSGRVSGLRAYVNQIRDALDAYENLDQLNSALNSSEIVRMLREKRANYPKIGEAVNMLSAFLDELESGGSE